MKINYREYDVSMRERCLYIGQGILLCVLVNYLFYREILAFLFMMPIPFLWLRLRIKEKNQRRKTELSYQFRDALNILSVSLRAGYSIENSLIETEKDMRKLNGSGSEMVQELSYMNRQIKVSISAEELLTDLGTRSDVEDIKNFASVFAIARRTGGNMAEIVTDCAAKISEKIEVDKAVEIAVAAKRFEQTIMSCMPCGIILYMQMTSPGFFNDLYGTVFGVVFMTICLILYGASFWMGRKIVRIEV